MENRPEFIITWAGLAKLGKKLVANVSMFFLFAIIHSSDTLARTLITFS